MPAPFPLLALALLSTPPPPEAPSEHRTQVRPDLVPSPPTAVLGQDRLREDAVADLATLLDGEPGLTVPRLGGLGSYATLSIRGATPEQVLIALDGIPLNPADGAPVDLSTLPVGPLSHLAIHRGRTPWSLGQVGLGGALRLETRRARTFDTALEFGAGSFATRALRAFAADRAYTVAIDYLGTASDFRYTNDGGTAWTNDDDRVTTRSNAASDQVNALARVALEGDAWRLVALNALTHLERGLPGLGIHPTRESGLTFTRNVLGLRFELAAPALITATTWLSTSTSALADPLGELGVDASPHTSLVPGAVMTAQLPLGPLAPTLHLAWRHEATSGDDAPEARDIASVALELPARLPHLELGAGLRLETAETLGLAAYGEAALTLAETRLTLGLSRAPRIPSLFELHGDLGTVRGNPDLRPETATTLELGARWIPDVGPHRLELAAFAFATAADDLIQFVQNAQGVARPENLASARILGLELALEADLFDRLALRTALTLLDTTDTSDIAARRGRQLPLRPGLRASQRLEYHRDDGALGARGAYGLSLELDHVSANVADFANLVHIPARTLLGAGAFVRSDQAEVRLTLSNLLDDRVQDLAGFPLPGLTAHLSLRLTP
jgi:outer membrane cobalamin receptor